MRIKTVYLTNFKTYLNQTVDVSPLTIVIGENASGKTNLLLGIRFLKNIARNGIDAAVAIAGGRYFSTQVADNNALKNSTTVGVALDLRGIFPKRPGSKKENVLHFNKISYAVSIRQSQNRVRDQWFVEQWEETLEYLDVSDSTGNILGNITIIQSNTTPEAPPTVVRSGRLTEDQLNSIFPIEDRDWLNHRWDFGDHDREQVSFLNSGRVSPLLFWIDRHVRFYDPLPWVTQSFTELSGVSELDESGANFSDVLQEIERQGRIDEVNLLIQRIFPKISSICSIQLADGRWTWGLQEKVQGLNMPARILSAGQVRGVALILALFQSAKDDVLIIEEPEQYLHPATLGPFLDLVREVIKEHHCQIILTTQHPEVLAQVSNDDSDLAVLWVRRDQEGISQVQDIKTIPALNEWVKNLGVASLYIDNFLESIFEDQ